MITIKVPYKDHYQAEEVVQWCTEQRLHLRYYEDSGHTSFRPYSVSNGEIYLSFHYLLDEDLTMLRLRWGA